MTIELNLTPFRRATSTGPGDAAQPGSAGRSSSPEAALQDRQILIVEDESVIAMMLSDALEDAGAGIVGPCYTLAECLRSAREERIDAAVLDVDLAGEDVFPAAEDLRRRGIPFVFHTAHGYRDELRSRFGNVVICRKPVGMAELIGTLARIIEGTPRN